MFTKQTLPNGLRVLTAPMQGTNTVTILVMCATGSDYETERERGLSHFLEHMFFKGTANRPTPAKLRQEIDWMGSVSNAFTGHETTGYFIKAASLYAIQSLDILADIYKNSLLPPGEIEREKQVVIEEMRHDHDDPMSHIWRMWERHLYGDEPAGRDIAGDEATIRALGRGDLTAYFGHQYVSKNTAVIIAGNIDEKKITDAITDRFSDIRDSVARSSPRLTERQERAEFSSEERAIEQTHLVVGFRGYDILHLKRFAADLLASILGGSWSSRMFDRVREKLGLAYTVYSDSENYSNRGYIVTYAGVAHENAGAAAGAILDEYRRIREEPVAEEELSRTKQFLKGRILMALETSNAVASFIGAEEILTGKPLTPDEVFARMEAVTSADIQAVAQELFRPDRLNAVLLGPRAGVPAAEAQVLKFA